MEGHRALAMRPVGTTDERPAGDAFRSSCLRDLVSVSGVASHRRTADRTGTRVARRRHLLARRGVRCHDSDTTRRSRCSPIAFAWSTSTLSRTPPNTTILPSQPHPADAPDFAQSSHALSAELRNLEQKIASRLRPICANMPAGELGSIVRTVALAELKHCLSRQTYEWLLGQVRPQTPPASTAVDTPRDL
jgi:hypothetical protein